jgi:small subunit ribosomal protein S17
MMTAAETTLEETATVKKAIRTQKVGKVVSDGMDKTVVVSVDYVRRHPIYHKRIRRTSKFMAHDEQNTCKVGDIVRIEETRPLSKRKRWIVREILERSVEI